MATSPATGSVSGYLYQFQYALYRLMHASADSLIGVETEDDVTEIKHTKNGVEMAFTQAKFSLQSNGQPIGNRSRNFWHTLHIWLELADKHPNAKKEFYFLTNREVPADAIVRRLADAEDAGAAKEVIKELREAGDAVNEKAATAAAAVLNYSDAELAALILHVNLIDNDTPDGERAMREATIDLFQLHDGQAELGNQIYEALLGMLVERCRTAWLSKQPANFNKSPFANRLQREVIAHRRRRYVEQPFHSLALQEYLSQDHNDLAFLRQIEHLGLTKKDWERALNDYWGFYAERVRLREIGEILPDEWTTRDEALHRRWEDICDAHEQTQNRQHDIYSNTVKSEYHGPLGSGVSAHAYFTAGNYHALANGENARWPLCWCETLESDEK